MKRTAWWDYVQRLMDARDLTAADLSRRSGVDQSVIGRWRDRGAKPSPENVRKIALALGQYVAQAAVQAGHYTAEELSTSAVVDPEEVDLSAISDDRVLDEVRTRMRGGHRGRPTGPRRRRPTPVAQTTDVRPMPSHRETTVRDEPPAGPPARRNDEADHPTGH